MDLSTVWNAAGSVVIHAPHIGGRAGLYRALHVDEGWETALPTIVLAAQRNKSRGGRSYKFNRNQVVSQTTGSVARISEIDVARSSASVSLLLDTPGQQHSRMDETAFLEENNTDTRDICAGNSASVGLRFVTAKRERNSMKPNLRQTSKDVGATNPNPVATAHAFEKQSASQSEPKHNEIGGRVSL